MKYCEPCGANWLDGMVRDDKCPCCAAEVSEITTVTQYGIIMDELSKDTPWKRVACGHHGTIPHTREG